MERKGEFSSARVVLSFSGTIATCILILGCLGCDLSKLQANGQEPSTQAASAEPAETASQAPNMDGVYYREDSDWLVSRPSMWLINGDRISYYYGVDLDKNVARATFLKDAKYSLIGSTLKIYVDKSKLLKVKSPRTLTGFASELRSLNTKDPYEYYQGIDYMAFTNLISGNVILLNVERDGQVLSYEYYVRDSETKEQLLTTADFCKQ